MPNYVAAKTHMTPALPTGYDCDTINADVLLDRLIGERGPPDAAGRDELSIPGAARTGKPGDVAAGAAARWPNWSGQARP